MPQTIQAILWMVYQLVVYTVFSTNSLLSDAHSTWT